jgi:hypothetical protein
VSSRNRKGVGLFLLTFLKIKMRAKYSYVMLVYNRHGGARKVTRYCRIDTHGQICYIEKRELTEKTKQTEFLQPIMWKIGNVSFLNVLQNNMFPSTKAEYHKNMKLAVKAIM